MFQVAVMAAEAALQRLGDHPMGEMEVTRDTTNLQVVFEDTGRGSRSNICVRLLLLKGFSMVLRFMIVAKR